MKASSLRFLTWVFENLRTSSKYYGEKSNPMTSTSWTIWRLRRIVRRKIHKQWRQPKFKEGTKATSIGKWTFPTWTRGRGIVATLSTSLSKKLMYQRCFPKRFHTFLLTFYLSSKSNLFQVSKNSSNTSLNSELDLAYFLIYLLDSTYKKYYTTFALLLTIRRLPTC